MVHSHTRRFTVAVAALMAVVPRLSGADHGPVFGLATPTNPQGGWSFDLGVNGRGGTGGVTSTLEAELSYGVTQNLKLAVSGPVVFEPDRTGVHPSRKIRPSAPISAGLHGGGFRKRILLASGLRVPPSGAFWFPARSRKPRFTGA
jgi:hypothetical protein